MDLFASRPRRRTKAAVLGAVAVLSLGACASGGTATTDRPGAQPTQGGLTLGAYWALTGLPRTGSPLLHPPLVVKIDNTDSSRPQLGLAKADLVTEELVEGGLTRLAVFFDTRLPTTVGPVRSMRASDIGLVKPVKGVVVTSGAAAPTIARLRKAGVTFASENRGAPGFFRDGTRTSPYNLMMRLGVLAKTLEGPTEVSPPYLPWGHESDFAGGARATTILARFGVGHTSVWSYRGGRYTNTNSNAARGTDFRPDTVLVVRVGVRDAGYRDPAGHFVPESITTGSGRALVFHRGRVQRGTWYKAGPTHTFGFRTRAGRMRIPAGHTWIEVLPVDAKGGSLTFR